MSHCHYCDIPWRQMWLLSVEGRRWAHTGMSQHVRMHALKGLSELTSTITEKAITLDWGILVKHSVIPISRGTAVYIKGQKALLTIKQQFCSVCTFIHNVKWSIRTYPPPCQSHPRVQTDWGCHPCTIHLASPNHYTLRTGKLKHKTEYLEAFHFIQQNPHKDTATVQVAGRYLYCIVTLTIWAAAS